MRAGLWILIGCAAWSAGCRREAPLPETAVPAATNVPAAVTNVPTELEREISAARTEIMVKVDPNAAARAEPTYTEVPDLPSGRLSGVCRFEPPVRGRLDQVPPADLTNGPWACANPLPGELDYYVNARVRPPQYWRQEDRFISPTHVVLLFRDVRQGRRKPLLPTGFMAIHGYCRALSGNYGEGPISFAPAGSRPTFFTYEAFPATFVLTRADSGAELFRGKVSYVDEGRKNARQVGDGHSIWIASKPEPIQGPILREPGLYKVAVERRPWQFGYLWLVDNPYVAVVGGSFDIGDLPAGRLRVEVWHPEYEPVEKTVEIEIQPDATAEIVIRLKTPPSLLAAEKKQRGAA